MAAVVAVRYINLGRIWKKMLSKKRKKFFTIWSGRKNWRSSSRLVRSCSIPLFWKVDRRWIRFILRGIPKKCGIISLTAASPIKKIISRAWNRGWMSWIRITWLFSLRILMLMQMAMDTRGIYIWSWKRKRSWGFSWKNRISNCWRILNRLRERKMLNWLVSTVRGGSGRDNFLKGP